MQLTIKQKYIIKTLYDEGYTIIKISKKLNINKKTVSYWLTKIIDLNTVERKPRANIKKKTTKEEDKQIIDMVKNNNKLSLVEINGLLKDNEIYISIMTISRRLKEYNFIYAYPINKPKLTEKHKKIRLEWAIKYWKVNWNFYIFSDEASVWMDRLKRKYWMSKEEPMVKRTIKHPIKKQLWGCICSNKEQKKLLHIFDYYLNGEKYKNLLKNNFLPYYDKKYTLQHDNDSKHKCKLISNFLSENNIQIFDWPSMSPDLNPIEHCWFLVKFYLSKMDVNNENYEEKIMEAWNKINDMYIINLINSMYERLECIINNNGDYIDY